MFGGLPGTVLDLAFLRLFVLIISPVLLEELTEKLKFKFEVSDDDVLIIRAKLGDIAEVTTPNEALRVIEEDPDDDRVLECAEKGRADYIVRHLLKLGAYKGTSIVTRPRILKCH